MKKLIFILAIISCQVATAQTDFVPRISYISPKRDTLILPNNPIGELIKNLWIDNPKQPIPVILVASEETINKRNKIVYDNRRRIYTK